MLRMPRPYPHPNRHSEHALPQPPTSPRALATLESIITYGIRLSLRGPAEPVRLPAGPGLAAGVRTRRRAVRRGIPGVHAPGLAPLRPRPLPAALPGLHRLPAAARRR